MVTFTARVLRFAKQGEKTGWTYIEIPMRIANKINPGVRKSYRIKGKLDSHPIAKQSILPMGDGIFILTLNAKLRKAIGKKQGDSVKLSIELDKREPQLSADLMECLKAEPEALKFFKTLTKSHQHYFSGWIESAKTVQTKTKRIVMALNAFAKRQGFPEMLREHKANRG